MPSYSFEFDMDGPHGGSMWGVYKTDGYARAAAVRMFRNRSVDPNDELHVYNGDATVDNYLGKVAYRHDAETIDWFPASQDT
jgi:hypothetical protein